jgi:hypothetical protein
MPLPIQDVPSTSEELVLSRAATVGVRLMNWFGIKRKTSSPLTDKGPPEEPSANLPVMQSTRDFDEYDWDGFECPYCHATGFVSCADGHLVCDSSVELRDGKRFHRCYCGIDGFLEQSISAIEGEFVSVERHLDAAQSSTLPNRATGNMLPFQTTPPTKR